MTVSGECRINETNSSTIENVIAALSGGVIGSMTVLAEWARTDPLAMLAFLNALDLKHLYDSAIWEVYKLCGQDLDRFIYHVCMELPNQATGELGVTGSYCSQVDLESFSAKRKFGKPGSYWALEHPPTEEDYAYPIV